LFPGGRAFGAEVAATTDGTTAATPARAAATCGAPTAVAIEPGSSKSGDKEDYQQKKPILDPDSQSQSSL